MLLAALPWTYWMALPFLVGSVMVLLSFVLAYLKKVVEPDVLRLDAVLAARYGDALGHPGDPVRQGDRPELAHGTSSVGGRAA